MEANDPARQHGWAEQGKEEMEHHEAAHGAFAYTATRDEDGDEEYGSQVM